MSNYSEHTETEEESGIHYIHSLRPPAVEVGLGEMKKVMAPGVLCSGELGPCIAIAVFCPDTQVGYMMHQADFMRGGLEAKFEQIRAELGEFSGLQVAAYGSAAIPGTDPLYLHNQYRDRQYISFFLEAQFSSEQLHIEWVRNPRAQLILDTGRGFFMTQAPEQQASIGA